MLAQLLFTSRSSADHSATVLEEMCTDFSEAFRSNQITGLLLYGSRNFLGVMEGEYRTLMTQYDRVQVDDRHRMILRHYLEPTINRLFPAWHMGVLSLEGDKQFDHSSFKSLLTIDKEEAKASRSCHGMLLLSAIREFREQMAPDANAGAISADERVQKKLAA